MSANETEQGADAGDEADWQVFYALSGAVREAFLLQHGLDREERSEADIMQMVVSAIADSAFVAMEGLRNDGFFGGVGGEFSGDDGEELWQSRFRKVWRELMEKAVSDIVQTIEELAA